MMIVAALNGQWMSLGVEQRVELHFSNPACPNATTEVWAEPKSVGSTSAPGIRYALTMQRNMVSGKALMRVARTFGRVVGRLYRGSLESALGIFFASQSWVEVSSPP